jgi:surfactin synthase thioesterase subunit
MYETARRLIRTTGLRPQHLFASGARPPTVSGTKVASKSV